MIISPIAKRACGAVEIFSLLLLYVLLILLYLVAKVNILSSSSSISSKRQNKCFFQQGIKLPVANEILGWQSGVAIRSDFGVANQMSGVSSANPDTPLAPPLKNPCKYLYYTQI